MEKDKASPGNQDADKKGYNEKNPAQPQGPFTPAADHQEKKTGIKSNTADKKAKEDQQ